ncbi:MAG: hypothetical protein ACR2Q4_03605 [Geminicoccaceae bacterium]
MCGLCGLFGVAVHWTDVAAAPDAFAGGKEQTLRQERFARISLANRILRHYGLKLSDVAGRSYLLTSATGKQVIVPDIMAIWTEAEKLLGRPCDPLDPGLIEHLEAG